MRGGRAGQLERAERGGTAETPYSRGGEESSEVPAGNEVAARGWSEAAAAGEGVQLRGLARGPALGGGE